MPERPACTCLNDCKGGDYCQHCSHSQYAGSGTDANGKEWRWTFNPQFGPLFLRKDGEPLKRQPCHVNHPAWQPFERWIVVFAKPTKDQPDA